MSTVEDPRARYQETLQRAGAQPPGGPEAGYRGTRRPYAELPPAELVKLQDKWFDRVTQQRKHIERAALLGTAFLLDQQYVDFAGGQQGSKLVQQPPKRGRVRTIEQIIEPAYRAELARLLRNRPIGTVIPDGLDPEDYEAAEAADQLLQHVSRVYHQEEVTERAVQWQITAGTALKGVTWDPTKKDPEGQEGAFVFRALSPFEFGVPNVRTEDLNEQPYVMVTKTYELDEVEDIWGQRVRADKTGSYGSLDDRLASIVSGGTSTGRQDASESTIVKETWIKPQPMAPEGLVVVTAGGSVLEQTPWPEWALGQYPFDVLRYIPIPGSFWGKSMLSALIPIQRRHNRAASIVVETQNILAQQGVAAPRGTNVRAILGGRGTLYETPPGATIPVTNITAPPVGDFPFRELEHTRQAVRDISSQHEVTKGYTPPNVRSGTAISMLKEVDDSAASIPIRNIERVQETIANHILRIVKAHWTEPRLIKVLSREGDLERISFVSGDDVGGQYAVEGGSAWPYMRAEKQGMLMQLHERGLIGNEEVLKYLDIGAGGHEIRQARELEYRHVRRENQKFEGLKLTVVDDQIGPDGLLPYPEDWHNHVAHISVHNQLRKSPKYEKWPEWKQRAFEAHITGHMAVLYSQIVANPAMMAQPGVAEALGSPPPIDQGPTESGEPQVVQPDEGPGTPGPEPQIEETP